MDLDLLTQLRVNRTLRRWSQEDAADAAGLTFYRYRRLELGKAEPTPEELAQLARAFDLPPAALATAPRPSA